MEHCMPMWGVFVRSCVYARARVLVCVCARGRVCVGACVDMCGVAHVHVFEPARVRVCACACAGARACARVRVRVCVHKAQCNAGMRPALGCPWARGARGPGATAALAGPPEVCPGPEPGSGITELGIGEPAAGGHSCLLRASNSGLSRV